MSKKPHLLLVKPDDPDLTNKYARDYLARGWAPIPVPFGSKGPTLKGWTKLEVTVANVDVHFPKGVRGNIGILMGPRSNRANHGGCPPPRGGFRGFTGLPILSGNKKSGGVAAIHITPPV